MVRVAVSASSAYRHFGADPVVVPDADSPLLSLLLEEAEMFLRRATADGDGERVFAPRQEIADLRRWLAE